MSSKRRMVVEWSFIVGAAVAVLALVLALGMSSGAAPHLSFLP